MATAEHNRNQRRDKKIQKKTRGMRVDDSAKKLAKIKLSKTIRTDNIWPGIGMPFGHYYNEDHNLVDEAEI